MTPIVVVEFDETLRGALRDILTSEGSYDVTEVAEHAVALAHLASVPEGTVTVVSNRDADHHHSAAFFAAVVTDERLATRHRYIMLSTNPEQIPDGMRAHLTYLHAPILAKPFDVDTLLAAVLEAVAHRVRPLDRYETPTTTCEGRQAPPALR